MAVGRIIKALSGFYYVQSNEGVYACKGRGVFRNKNITPLVGDDVEFEVRNEDEGYIMKVKDRSNELIRPPVANIDQVCIVNAATSPELNPLLLDRFLVLIEAKHIQPIIFITKMDLATQEEIDRMKEYQSIYQNIGYEVKLLSSKEPEWISEIIPYFKNKVSVFAGQSGVGKSSLLNTLDPNLYLETAEISKSLGRGKHTTRHVELLPIGEGLVADTPGFSVLEFSDLEAEDLGPCFPEIRLHMSDCKFRGCLHDKEPKCAVKAAVNDGVIAEFRYQHYLRFLEEIKTRKPRY
ncbi:ribosome small subunit-dependent GTPase A [Oceanobacillus jeddahense]|uniref:Small ribosomal subunit biogenesis GTPase RsgA n=1 Tax=Oceanobacillus jeddahense TaxID=1462527 RepID=A0ABY5JSK1_9BACI|nr:ribosome small subunit-dependent GTPase A [Oceanobacillus jeddahense]UUI01584.1 ribosome small subunit-dependent GTPase A [Oceanobacillus jeddahense]